MTCEEVEYYPSYKCSSANERIKLIDLLRKHGIYTHHEKDMTGAKFEKSFPWNRWKGIQVYNERNACYGITTTENTNNFKFLRWCGITTTMGNTIIQRRQPHERNT